MKYRAVIKLSKRPKTVTKLRKMTAKFDIPRVKSVFKVPKEIITKLKILESIKGSYFLNNLIKTSKGEYFS